MYKSLILSSALLSLLVREWWFIPILQMRKLRPKLETGNAGMWLQSDWLGLGSWLLSWWQLGAEMAWHLWALAERQALAWSEWERWVDSYLVFWEGALLMAPSCCKHPLHPLLPLGSVLDVTDRQTKWGVSWVLGQQGPWLKALLEDDTHTQEPVSPFLLSAGHPCLDGYSLSGWDLRHTRKDWIILATG